MSHEEETVVCAPCGKILKQKVYKLHYMRAYEEDEEAHVISARFVENILRMNFC